MTQQPAAPLTACKTHWQPAAGARCTILGGEHRGRVAELLGTPDGRTWHVRVGSAEVRLERAALGPPPS